MSPSLSTSAVAPPGVHRSPKALCIPCWFKRRASVSAFLILAVRRSSNGRFPNTPIGNCGFRTPSFRQLLAWPKFDPERTGHRLILDRSIQSLDPGRRQKDGCMIRRASMPLIHSIAFPRTSNRNDYGLDADRCNPGGGNFAAPAGRIRSAQHRDGSKPSPNAPKMDVISTPSTPHRGPRRQRRDLLLGSQMRQNTDFFLGGETRKIVISSFVARCGNVAENVASRRAKPASRRAKAVSSRPVVASSRDVVPSSRPRVACMPLIPSSTLETRASRPEG